MINRIGRYRKTEAEVRSSRIHIYDEHEHKVICNKDSIRCKVRVRAYETEEEMLAEFLKWESHCKHCARILKSRIT